MRDRERDQLRRVILELVSRGFVHWTEIEKRACASCFDFATSNTVRRQFYGYLMPCGFVERVGRGRYQLTDKGRDLLTVLSHG
jgi:predicted transcriptional regulator